MVVKFNPAPIRELAFPSPATSLVSTADSPPAPTVTMTEPEATDRLDSAELPPPEDSPVTVER
jgi:hypothetical protein